jgi:hypothetical protein
MLAVLPTRFGPTFAWNKSPQGPSPPLELLSCVTKVGVVDRKRWDSMRAFDEKGKLCDSVMERAVLVLAPLARDDPSRNLLHLACIVM